MQRNPNNGATPRTMRDCTFCEWADPIERYDAESAGQALAAVAILVVLCLAGGMVVWKAVM